MHLHVSFFAVAVIASTVAHAQICTLAIPAQPFTAEGLATPYELGGGCSQADANTQCFVEASILDLATGKLYAYAPLVIDKGTQPLVKPVVPTLPANYTVGIWFGSNNDNLKLVNAKGTNSLKDGKCVNGVKDSIFGQFASCGGAEFFQKALVKVKAPSAGNTNTGDPCPTTRSFGLVDQDQSDNVITTYLQVGKRSAPDTPENRKKFPKATVISNGSDNALLAKFVDPAVGCTAFEVDALDGGVKRGTLAANEISAAQNQKAPIALTPLIDPMTLNNGKQDKQKTNLYRAAVGQSLIDPQNWQDTPAAYCKDLGSVGAPIILKQKADTKNFASPVPAMANNLFSFLAVRFNASWVNLNCEKFTGKPSPIQVTLDGNGLVKSVHAVGLGGRWWKSNAQRFCTGDTC